MNNLETVWSAGDLIASGLAYTVMGMMVVFFILITIMTVIKAMELFSVEKKKAPVEKQNTASEAAEVSVAETSVNAQTDESELIAVITAAVAAAMGSSSSSDFVIRSYKRVSGGAWNKAGRREVLDNRF